MKTNRYKNLRHRYKMREAWLTGGESGLSPPSCAFEVIQFVLLLPPPHSPLLQMLKRETGGGTNCSQPCSKEEKFQPVKEHHICKLGSSDWGFGSHSCFLPPPANYRPKYIGRRALQLSLTLPKSLPRGQGGEMFLFPQKYVNWLDWNNCRKIMCLDRQSLISQLPRLIV